jgi:transposase InsO family protein
VARELTALIEQRGKPQMIVSDNGTEFTSNAILSWSKEHTVEWHYIAPGKPMQNGYIESFNGRMVRIRRRPRTRSPAAHDVCRDYAAARCRRWRFQFQGRSSPICLAG